MRTLPEIDPEVRGLLEEIVADPRSCLRLVPRKPLKAWFDSDETVRASDVSGTKAERHLIEAHREALAELLREAARIAYWKAPVLCHRPTNQAGQLCNPADAESAWLVRARARASQGGPFLPAILTSSIDSLDPRHAPALARASLGLAARDSTRCLAVHVVPWEQPALAIHLFERLLVRLGSARLRAEVFLALGSRLCALGLLSRARDAYRSSSAENPLSPYGAAYAFNLSCVLSDDSGALREAKVLADAVTPRDPRIVDVVGVLRDWLGNSGASFGRVAARVADRLSGGLPDAALALTKAYES